MRFIYILASTLGMSGAAVAYPHNYAKEIVVYSSVNSQMLKPIFEQFAKETGIQVKPVNGSDETLIARIASEGKASEADIFLSMDAGALWQGFEQKIGQPAVSEYLDSSIPASMRESKNNWVGYGVRATGVVFNKKKIKADELSRFTDLGKPEYQKKICKRISPGTNKGFAPQTLITSMLTSLGEKDTAEYLTKLTANLSGENYSSDKEILAAIANGKCDIGLVSQQSLAEANQVKPLPDLTFKRLTLKDQHFAFNLTGLLMTKFSPNKEKAIIFIEWLATPVAQLLIEKILGDTPVSPKVKPGPERLDLKPIDFAKTAGNWNSAGKILSQSGLK